MDIQKPLARYCDPKYYNAPYIRKDLIEYRAFQVDTAKESFDKNIIAIIPTGMGKTIIAIIAIDHMLSTNKGKRIIFLAPTRPLVNQHINTCQRLLIPNEIEMIAFAGNIDREKRKKLFDEKQIIFSTPQSIRNDLESGSYTLDDVSLIIFDECHKAIGNYAYVDISKHYHGRILGLTASPGSKADKIMEIKSNLKTDKLIIRTSEEAEIKEHIKETDVIKIVVPLHDDIIRIRKPLEKLLYERIRGLKKVGFLNYKKLSYVSKKDLIKARQMISMRLKTAKKKTYLFSAFLNQYIALQAYHCIELLETQGIDPMLSYLSKFDGQGHNRNENIFRKNPLLVEARNMAENSKRISHPKLRELQMLIKKQMDEKKDSLMIIFTQYRVTIDTIMMHINLIDGVKCRQFIGQGTSDKQKGMTQEEQKKVIDEFRTHKINCIIATSVAEEGIDIPGVDIVVFYEPIPSEIRTIQRRGRTGRSTIGKVAVLVAEDTRDEAFFKIEAKKEKDMERIVKRMK